MTDTIQTPADTAADEATEAEEFLHLDPADIIIGTNVRTDLRADHKEFRKSIKERGVLEAVTVYRNEDGQYVLLRGQRRTVTAAEVGTPTGLIPARVVPQPADADRIGDQMVENIHRAGMRETEIVAGVEQLALLGVSAAQIAKRTSIDRPTVNAALAVTKADQTRNRLDSGDLTLEEAAIFAEFEHDPEAVERLENAKRWRRSLAHEAQRLRDEAAEREADAAEVERLRAEGLPVLTAEEVAEADEVLRIERLVTADGEPLPEEEWPNVPGARVQVVKEWVYPEDEYDEDDEDDRRGRRGRRARRALPAVRAGVGRHRPRRLRPRRRGGGSGGTGTRQRATTARARRQAEARREERRRVIANNKAWASAETVRREWLARFLARKTAPKGAEALICEAVVTGHHSLSKAMDHRHPMLFTPARASTSRPATTARAHERVPQDRDQGQHAEGRDHDHPRRRRRRVGGHDRQALVAQPEPRGTPACSARSWSGATSPARSSGSCSARSRSRAPTTQPTTTRRGQRQRRLIGSTSPP